MSRDYLGGTHLAREKWRFPLRPSLLAAVALLAAALAGPARALPVTGQPVPNLAAFDQSMQDFMGQQGLGAGVLAVSKDGCVVYQRGFGTWMWGFSPLPENTPCDSPAWKNPSRRRRFAGWWKRGDWASATSYSTWGSQKEAFWISIHGHG